MLRQSLALLLLAAPAAAHVTIQPAEAPANGFARLAFAVPHGCAGAATSAIEVTLPEEVAAARPMPKPGWEVVTELRPLARPVAGPHGLIREAPASVAWRGGRLADAHYEEFVMLVRTPDRPGETLRFAVVQLCEGGARADWSGDAGSRQPAATLRLAAR